MRITRTPQIFATTVLAAVVTASTLSSCGQPSTEVFAPPAAPVVSTATASPAAEVEPAPEAPTAASAPTPMPEPSSATAPAPEDDVIQAASDDRLVIERLGIDVPLRSFTPEGGVADPPTWDDAWLADLYGSPSNSDSGTSIVFLHSGIREPDAVGNRLLDRDTHSSTLHEGDVMHVDGYDFTVSSTHVLSKDEVESGAQEVWLNQDGRLVVITCLARPGERKAVDVIAVVAQRSA